MRVLYADNAGQRTRTHESRVTGEKGRDGYIWREWKSTEPYGQHWAGLVQRWV